MKKTAKLLIAMFIFSSMNSFAGDTPKCSDPTVKNSIYRIFKNEIGRQLFSEIVMESNKNPDWKSDIKREKISDQRAFSYIGNEIGQTNSMIVTMCLGQKTPAQFRSEHKNDRIASLLSEMDKRIEAMSFNLSGTRMDKKDEKIQKCVCSGEISMSGSDIIRSVTYSTQFTDDGQVYVQLLGVR